MTVMARAPAPTSANRPGWERTERTRPLQPMAKPSRNRPGISPGPPPMNTPIARRTPPRIVVIGARSRAGIQVEGRRTRIRSEERRVGKEREIIEAGTEGRQVEEEEA